MTDGPFAYPLNLWLFGRDARGPEPIQRSISSSLLDFPMPLTLSSLPSVRPFGISLSDPRWFLLLLLESSLVSSRPFHVTGILSCVSSVAIVPLFFSLLYFPIVGYSYVSFMFLFLDDLSLSLSLVSVSYLWRDAFTFPSCLSLFYVATTGAVLFRD